MADETPTAAVVRCDEKVRVTLAIITLLQFAGVLGYAQVTRTPLPNDVLNAELMLVTLVLSYYFGSSSGSKAKDQVPK